jgi:2-dehydropantoate 2-reductase
MSLALATLRRTGFPIDELPDLRYGRWEKQLWNVPFNGLGAALLADTELLLRTPHGRGLVSQVMAEVLETAHADGRTLPDSMPDAKLHYTLGMGPYKTSMQLDREAGREMEIQAILSSVIRIADSHNLRIPTLRQLEVLLKSVDTATPPA